MAKFAKVVEAVRPPGRTLILEPSVFADEWGSKPKSAVCVGLRLISEADKAMIRGESEKLADEFHPKRGELWIEAYNDAVLRHVVALGICDPNNVSQPCSLLPYAEDEVRIALTSRGVQFIFEAIERYEIESSPIGAAATDETLADLAAVLPKFRAEQLTPAFRRLVQHVFEQLESAAQ